MLLLEDEDAREDAREEAAARLNEEEDAPDYGEGNGGYGEEEWDDSKPVCGLTVSWEVGRGLKAVQAGSSSKALVSSACFGTLSVGRYADGLEGGLEGGCRGEGPIDVQGADDQEGAVDVCKGQG